jgi:FixJ family two-component response regulator
MRPHAQLISVVDDDASIRQALAGLFRSVGSPAATFATAEEFLRSDRPGTTACLVLDLQMPGMGGHELQEELVREGYRRAGAVAFLRKPFDTEALRSSVEAALRDREQEEVVKHARAAR